MEKVIIFDTTLRDGEQSPGASLNNKEKLEIAFQLQSLGVDVIEAGFPVSSPGDFDAVRTVAREIKGPVICGLARSVKKDIDAAYESLKHAARPRIHVFLATSKIHMKYKLKKAEDEILKTAVWAVKYARSLMEDVEFSPEDASRTERRFLYQVVEAVIDAGAGTVNIPDTVGYSTPTEFGSVIRDIRRNVPNIDRAVISVHCHNDLGLGVANSLSAVSNGARQVECTINGLGERAGNASLEEIVMALKTRQDIFKVETGIKTRQICKTSRLVSKLTGISVQPNKAIVGRNAFSHESGIHQDGLIKEKSTYEIIRPEDVGYGVTNLVLGKHSGRHAFNVRLVKLGYKLSAADMEKAFVRFKQLADKKKEIFDEDIASLAEDQIGSAIPEKFRLAGFKAMGSNEEVPNACIRISVNGKEKTGESEGDGPVDASFKAIDKVTGIKGRLTDYQIRAVTRGKDALGEVSLRYASKGREFSGRGLSTDIIEASIKAYIDAVNKVAHFQKRKK